MPTSSSSSSRALFSRRFLHCTRSTWPHPSPAHHRLQEKPPCNGLAPIRMDKVVRYIDCRKNHAASTGGYVVDGCTEFMASGGEETVAALTCAACGCHRSFHRRLVIPDCCSNSASPR